jgi:hypothetical protein
MPWQECNPMDELSLWAMFRVTEFGGAHNGLVGGSNPPGHRRFQVPEERSGH